jgi:hypothetical protein
MLQRMQMGQQGSGVDPNMAPSLQNDARQIQPRFFPQNAQDPMERGAPNIDRNAIPPEVLQQLEQMKMAQGGVRALPMPYLPQGGPNWGPRPPWNPSPAAPTGYPSANPPPISTG